MSTCPWIEKNKDDLWHILMRYYPCDFGIFLMRADKLPHPFGHWGWYGTWVEGSNVHELKIFWEEYKAW